MLLQQCLSCLPTAACSARASVPGTALAPALPLLPAAVQGLGHHGQRRRELPWHMVHGEHGRARSLPPACGQPARPGKARDSLGLLAQEPFPPAPAGHSPTGGPPWPSPSRLAWEGWGQRSAVHPLAAAQSPVLRAGRCSGGIAAWPGTGCSSLLWAAPAACPAGICAGRQTSLWEVAGRVLAACSWWEAKPLVLRDNLRCRRRALPVQTQ